MAMDSDGEREDEEERLNSLFETTEQPESSTCTSCPVDEIDGPRPRASCLITRPPHKVVKLL